MVQNDPYGPCRFLETRPPSLRHLPGHADFMRFAFCDHGEGRQIAIVVQQQMELHRSFRPAKLGPIKHRGAQINHRGVQAQQGILEAEFLFLLRPHLMGR